VDARGGSPARELGDLVRRDLPRPPGLAAASRDPSGLAAAPREPPVAEAATPPRGGPAAESP
jgi:hypothetical protein